MLSFKKVKKWIVVVCAVVIVGSSTGCVKELYHNGEGKDWIMEQVQQGKLTQEQADELLKQEK